MKSLLFSAKNVAFLHISPIEDVLRLLLAATGATNGDAAALLRRLQQPEPTATAAPPAPAATKREKKTQLDMSPGEEGWKNH